MSFHLGILGTAAISALVFLVLFGAVIWFIFSVMNSFRRLARAHEELVHVFRIHGVTANAGGIRPLVPEDQQLEAPPEATGADPGTRTWSANYPAWGFVIGVGVVAIATVIFVLSYA